MRALKRVGKLSTSRQLNMRFSFSPTSRLLRGLAGWTLLGLVPAVWPELTGFWLLVSGLLLVVAAWDAALLRRRPR